MKPLRTPDTNTTLTLPGGTIDNDLPAQRVLAYDDELGQTRDDAQAAWITLWMPDEREAQKLEAGAAVEITIFGAQHPPIVVGVTEAAIPEREMIDRGHVDRALGHLYATLAEDFHNDDGGTDLPDPPEFADLWATSVQATRTDRSDPTTTTADATI